MKRENTGWFTVAVVAAASFVLLQGCRTSVDGGRVSSRPWQTKRPDKNITPIPGPEVGALMDSPATARAITDPRGLPSLDEEVWVIARSHYRTTPRDDDTPRCGALFGFFGGKKMVPLPLKHTDVKATVEGYLATTKVTQEFGNPYSSKIEAVYVFPLPQDAAINEFVMTIGKRKIRGIIREKEEARKMYEAAKSQGYTAALLEQDRPNVFTQSVANIEPGKQIDITIR
ncbi:MAG: VIT domain-containing protein [Limisphaerales bacterium]